MAFSEIEELQIYINERERFISNEIQYASQLAALMEGNAEYGKRLQSYVRALLAVLRYLQDLGKRVTAPGANVEFRLLGRTVLDGYYGGLVEVLESLQASLLQRRHKHPRYFFFRPLTSPILPMSEVHVQYPFTVHALEAMANEYFRKLTAFFQPLGCASPIVVLTSETAVVCRRAKIPPRLPREDLATGYRNYVNLARLGMPRWTPAHIRYGAFLAHEEMHRLFFLLQLCESHIAELRAKLQIDDPSRQMTQSEVLIGIFGENAVKFTVVREDLRTEFVKFAAKQGWPEDDKRINDVTYRSLLARCQINELLCDLGALLLAGPAYLFCFMALFEADPRRTMENLRKSPAAVALFATHPPSVVRIGFQIELLRYLGFTSYYVPMFSRIHEKYKNLFPDPQVDSYLTWLTSPVPWGLFEECLHLIHNSIKLAGMEPYDARPHIKSEQDWRDHWKAIAGEVVKGRVLPSDVAALTPSDLLNAIWYKKTEEAFVDIPPQSTAWRMSISNTTFD